MTHPGEVNEGTIKLKARYVLKLPVELQQTEKALLLNNQKALRLWEEIFLEQSFQSSLKNILGYLQFSHDTTVCM